MNIHNNVSEPLSRNYLHRIETVGGESENEIWVFSPYYSEHQSKDSEHLETD